MVTVDMDSAAAAPMSVDVSPHVRSFPDTQELRVQEMMETLVSPRTGVIQAIRGPDTPLGLRGLYAHSARISTGRRDSRTAHFGVGAVDWKASGSLIATLAEGVERYVWSQQTGRPAMLTADEIERNGILSADFRATSSLNDVDHDEDGGESDASFEGTDVPWLPGRDLRSGRRRWAPAGVVVIGYDHPANHGYACDRTTTGMAAGRSATAALVGGAAEVIERDSYMVTHINRLRLPEIDLRSVPDPRVRSILDQLSERGKIRVRAWDMTLDTGVPTVLCGALVEIDGQASVRIAAATAVSAQRAVQKAFLEVIQCVGGTDEEEVRLRRASETVASTACDDISGHIGLGDHAEYVAAMDWLLHERPHKRSVQEMELMYESMQARSDPLRWLVERLHQSGFDAYGFELTPPELHELTGLHVWRVLIPGMQRLPVGRNVGLYNERVRWAPVRAGLRTSPLAQDKLNPLPHCFP